MPGKTAKSSEPLVAILESQVVPCWERFGLKRLAVTQKTLKQFEAQSPPDSIHTATKIRVGKRVKSRSARIFNNTGSFLESWPEDNQAIFRYPALVFLVSGQADFHVADYCLRCPPEHFLLFSDDVPRCKGGRPHLEGESCDGRHCVVLWFFAPPGTNSVIAYLCHSEGAKHWSDAYHIVPCPAAIHLFELAVQELQDTARRHLPIAALSMQTFLHLFLRELKEGRFHQAGKSSVASYSEGASPIEQAQRYVKNHLNANLTAERVAREVFMSRNSFIQHFKCETGETFHAFVTRERMEEAHRLLSEGHWSHGFICQFIGLRPTQFRTQFKQHFGVAPSTFRRQTTTNVQNR
jgi:AraC-like DNA-binding protein